MGASPAQVSQVTGSGSCPEPILRVQLPRGLSNTAAARPWGCRQEAVPPLPPPWGENEGWTENGCRLPGDCLLPHARRGLCALQKRSTPEKRRLSKSPAKSWEWPPGMDIEREVGRDGERLPRQTWGQPAGRSLRSGPLACGASCVSRQAVLLRLKEAPWAPRELLLPDEHGHRLRCASREDGKSTDVPGKKHDCQTRRGFLNKKPQRWL